MSCSLIFFISSTSFFNFSLSFLSSSIWDSSSLMYLLEVEDLKDFLELLLFVEGTAALLGFSGRSKTLSASSDASSSFAAIELSASSFFSSGTSSRGGSFILSIVLVTFNPFFTCLDLLLPFTLSMADLITSTSWSFIFSIVSMRAFLMSSARSETCDRWDPSTFFCILDVRFCGKNLLEAIVEKFFDLSFDFPDLDFLLYTEYSLAVSSLNLSFLILGRTVF
mmetsp:Transcript_19526/g.19193  ORF Transcript_19526/g.19193 Transcript_19526/m.19193 type:complete len:223 (+) Transcript_19526:202-870(+)